jgi:hypothetical protein
VKIKTHRTTVLSLVLYGYETWSITSREDRRLRVFENRVLRKVFMPKREKVTGNWRRLCREAPHALYKYFFGTSCTFQETAEVVALVNLQFVSFHMSSISLNI